MPCRARHGIKGLLICFADGLESEPKTKHPTESSTAKYPQTGMSIDRERLNISRNCDTDDTSRFLVEVGKADAHKPPKVRQEKHAQCRQ
eukprot:6461926-Amphidinium_carterae.2